MLTELETPFAQKPYETIIVGGGASGYFLAANLARTGRSALILEAGREALSKVRISGGGRCNVTHHEFDPERLVEYYPRGFRELRGAFSRFQPADMMEWLKERRIQTKVESDGRVFPDSDCSVSIIRCLENSARRHGVRVKLRTRVSSVAKPDAGSGFVLATSEGGFFRAQRLVLATGGSVLGHRLAKELGHTIVEPVPSLFSFNLSDPRLEGLAGLSFPDVTVKLKVSGKQFEQRGPVLVTHWGLSGPAILKLSAWAARELHGMDYHGTLQINFTPDLNRDQIEQWMRERVRSEGRKSLNQTQPPWFPKRYWRQLVAGRVGPDVQWSQVSKSVLRQLMDEVEQGSFTFFGKSTYKDEFVTAGGVTLSEVDLRTMESRVIPGLFVVGELLDVDGITGGFNFQNAWTTGMLCARHLEGVGN